MTHRSVVSPVALAILMALAMCMTTCSPERSAEPAEYRLATQVALEWNHLLLELEWHTPGYRPPVSARMFAYVEMAAYEAALPALKGYVSLESRCPGYHKVGINAENYDLPSALNAAYAYIAHAFFPTAPMEFQEKIKLLESRCAETIQDDSNPVAIQNSVEFGRAAAAAVWHYSMQDSIGHDGFMYNFDRSFVARDCKGCWKPEEERPMPPLLPNWGRVRSFVISPKEVTVKPPVAFDETAPSAFFSEAMEVFSISRSLSSEARWIAEFWSDDLPGLTITPTARWISITNQAIEKSSLTFPEVMEVYVKTAIALSDAAVICWDSKYKFQVERPESYIRRNIEPNWAPLHPTPSFPSYPSGHSIFGSAAAEVLSTMIDPHFAMADRTHEGRKEFIGKARSFNSFEEMAQENAYSRVLLGVHFRMDCEEGLRLGKIVGQKVAAMSLRNEQAAAIQEK